MSNTTSIVCSGYNRSKNEFVFISKNSYSEDRSDYHLNVHSRNINQATSLSLPLSSVENFPDARNYSFGGVCTYASSDSSVYLNFDSVPESSSNTSTKTEVKAVIYSLQLLGNTKQRFQQTTLELYDTKLSSLAYVAGINKRGSLAYVATSTTNNQMSINLANLDTPYEQQASRNITETGILAAGDSDSQLLYFIQNSTIDVYRLDTQQYSQSTIQTKLSSEVPIKATSGQVMFSSNRTVAYISVYHPESGKISIINHNLALSNYATWPLAKNGSISLPSGSRPPVTKDKTASTSTVHNQSSVSKTGTITASNSKTTIPIGTPSSNDEPEMNRFGNNNMLHKRAIEADSNNYQSSSDGAYQYHSAQIVNEAGGPFPKAALLVPSSNNNQFPPYNYALISNNGAQGFLVVTESGESRPSETSFPVDVSESEKQLDGGAIAGIVIGSVAFIAIIAGLLLYIARKRRERKRNYGTREIITGSRKKSSTALPTDPEEFLTPYIESAKEENGVNHSNTSSILQEATSIPEEYHDGSRPDIRPLSYSEDAVDYAQLPPQELLQLEPDVNGPLFLFSGLYNSSADERVTYLKDGYAVRAFDAGDGIRHTVHYFSAAHLDTFVRSVFTAIRVSKIKDSKPQGYVIKSERAIVLSSPTPHFNYQYIWITSPVIPENSLYHLLFEENRWSFIDYNNMDYKIWSIYAMLRSLEALHSHKFVHLAIDLKVFYFDHELKATDWRLCNFEYAHSLKQRGTARSKRILPPSTSFTAPEIIGEQGEITQINIDEEKLDIWSLGCVIYSVATGGRLLFDDENLVKNLITFNDDMRQHVRIAIRDNVNNTIFQTLLEKMLQVHPSDRKNIKELLDYWNSIFNMEE